MFIFLSIPLFSRDNGDTRHVLFLNSYDARMNWYKEILRGVEATLDPDNNNIILHLENLDSKEFKSDEYFRAYISFLKEKYKDHQFACIFASDNNAFDILREHNEDLFPGVPVVFCGVNDFEDSMIADEPLFTGIAEEFSIRSTVELALRLHPHTDQIYIINDYLNTGRAWQRDIEDKLNYFGDSVTLTYSENLPMEELRQVIAGLPETAIVLVGVYYTDRDGQFLTYEITGRAIASAAKVPVYCLTDFNITENVIGGDVLSGFAHGEAMALMGQRLMNGEPVENMPVVKEGNTRYMFNYPELEKYSIDPRDLPEGSLLLNKPFSVYDEFFWEIWISFFVFIILLASVVAMVINVARKNRAEANLRELTEASWEGIMIHEDGTILQTNQVFLDLFGYKREDVIGQYMLDRIFSPDSLEKVNERIASGDLVPYEAEGIKCDGSQFPMEVRVRTLESDGREVRLAAIRDLTEQKKMEERLAQSQKLQAIGTLAGGISHDFNNILGGVLGYADLGKISSEEGSCNHFYFDQILTAGTRARDLIRKILTFSRQSKREVQPVHYSAVIKESLELMKATLPSTIEIRRDLDEQICIKGDPVSLQQIIMNLCTNAALAMKKEGGILEVVFKESQVENILFSDMGVKSGRYGQLVVSDTGCGMSDNVKNRIFEPFFTTRKLGEGTGMGLSVVHGIVSDMGGTISVYSTLGQGTTFNVFLPVCPGTTAVKEEEQFLNPPGGIERILYVDDEEIQTNTAKDMLGYLGYKVLAVNSSSEALETFRMLPDAFDLVITDMTMPGMTGDALIEEIRRIKPGMRILLCTGYSEGLSKERLKELGIHKFVMKPLLLREMAVKVREALDS